VILHSCFVRYLIFAEMSSPDGKKFASSIPKVTKLRELLGFQDQSSDHSKIFNDKLRAFRREYRTSSGRPGTDLHDWRSRDGQSELSQMVNEFLVDNGQFFWPTISNNDNNGEPPKLQYPQNKIRYDCCIISPPLGS